jgi:UDP:flavonoid glycosyltransferase YjiC (YdhE family)
MRRILFASDGSSGDLLPIVLMAREFKLAGYEVCVCGSAELSPMAQDFGVPYEPYPHNYSKLYPLQHTRDDATPGDVVQGRVRAALEDRP